METARVRLVRKLAENIDGVDLLGRTVGDAFTLPRSEARLLVAEGWAIEVGNEEEPAPPLVLSPSAAF